MAYVIRALTEEGHFTYAKAEKFGIVWCKGYTSQYQKAATEEEAVSQLITEEEATRFENFFIAEAVAEKVKKHLDLEASWVYSFTVTEVM